MTNLANLKLEIERCQKVSNVLRQENQEITKEIIKSSRMIKSTPKWQHIKFYHIYGKLFERLKENHSKLYNLDDGLEKISKLILLIESIQKSYIRCAQSYPKDVLMLRKRLRCLKVLNILLMKARKKFFEAFPLKKMVLPKPGS